VTRVAYVVLYSTSDALIPVVADIDEAGKASLWTRDSDLAIDELCERTGMTSRDVMRAVEEKAAELFAGAPVGDEDPPSRRDEL
jgi:hypothetical protein